MTDEAPSLTLTIARNRETKEWEIASIQAAGNALLPLGADEIQGRARPSVEALCLLTLLTYLSRQEAPDQPDQIPDRFADSLAILYSGNKKEPSSWQRRIFGYQPFDGSATEPSYLRASQVNGRQQVRIVPEVTVIVRVMVGEKSRRTFQESDIVKICSDMVRPPKDNSLAIEISVKERSPILSSECVGELHRSSRFSVKVEGGIRSAFCVVWLGEQSGVNSLYPSAKWKLIYHEEEVIGRDHSQRQRLEITSEKLLEIPSSGGVEACLVLEKKTKFTKPEVREIVSSLEDMLSEIPEELPDKKPRFTPLRIPRQRYASRRIQPTATPDEWHESLSTALSGLAAKGHLFEVPFV